MVIFTPEAINNDIAAIDAAFTAAGKTTCANCGVVITMLGAIENIDGTYICDDCFFGAGISKDELDDIFAD